MEVDGQGAVLGTVQRVDGDGRGGTGWCSSRPLLTGVEVSVCHIYIPLRRHHLLLPLTEVSVRAEYIF